MDFIESRSNIYENYSRNLFIKQERDIEKSYSNNEFVQKLCRLADSIETGERFEIQIAGERIYVPALATFSVEHERDGDSEEIEFQIKWKNEPLA